MIIFTANAICETTREARPIACCPSSWARGMCFGPCMAWASGLGVPVHNTPPPHAPGADPDCNNKSQGLWWQDFPPKDEQAPKVGRTPAALQACP